MQGAMWAVLPTLVGFGLGQFVNLVALLWRLWMRPRLRIQPIGDSHVLLKHEEQVGPDEFQDKIIYGFKIQNCGRQVARGVRAYLLKTELRYKGKAFGQVSAHPYLLPWHGPQSNEHAAVLFPDESVTVELAFWQEDLSVVVPASGWKTIVSFAEKQCSSGSLWRSSRTAIGGRHVRSS